MADRLPAIAVPATSLKYRPRDYFGDFDLEAQLLTRVTGVKRRSLIRAALRSGNLDEVPEALLKSELGYELRTCLGRIHPDFMGGEYLPRASVSEVEIARIRIRSTTSDVTAVRARPVGRRIAYRVVDEYEGGSLDGRSQRTSLKPLTMGELLSFLLGAWDLHCCLQANFDDDLDGMLEFFSAESEYYPRLHEAVQQLVIDRHTGATAGSGDDQFNAQEGTGS